MSENVRILIAASGTGGHLFPALHIAAALKRQAPAVIEFIGSGRPLEAEIIDGAGYVRHVIDTVGIKQRGLKGLLEFALKLPKAWLQTWRIFSSYRPEIVVGVGGYVTFLPVLIARLRGIPSWIHEAERRPGLANYVLCFLATRVSLAYADARMPRRSNSVFTGHPVRRELLSIAAKSQFPERPRKLLVLGGSQGARALDLVLIELADFLRENGIEILHQCRAENLAAVRAAYERAGVPGTATEFLSAMAEAYAWSDVILARAGAGAVTEIGVVNRPAIFVPFPYAQGQHQLANAKILADAGKALIVEEGADFTQRLKTAFIQLLNPVNYRQMWEREQVGRESDAAAAIARGCLELTAVKTGASNV